MEIFPATQLLLLAAAFLCGVLFGILFDIGAALRIFLGAFQPPKYMRERYEKPLPLLGRAIGLRQGNKARRAWQALVVGAGDFFFCLAFALAIELVLYQFNFGEMRLSVPLVALFGLGLWRALMARPSAFLAAHVAFFVAAGALYLIAALLLPWRALRYLLGRYVIGPLYRACCRLHQKKKRHLSDALCAEQLLLAAAGLVREAVPPSHRRRKGERICRKKARAASRPSPSSSEC